MRCLQDRFESAMFTMLTLYLDMAAVRDAALLLIAVQEKVRKKVKKINKVSATKGTAFQQNGKKQSARSLPSGLCRACIIRQLSLVNPK